MGANRPKQYLPLLGKPLICHALAVLCASPEIDRVHVVLSPDDSEWARHDWSELGPRLLPLYCGGASRADSVLAGLRAIADELQPCDWILVHDAARPCLTRRHIASLVRELAADPVGGLLAVPVADTLKRSDGAGLVTATVPRENLWQAQTPQMFRHQVLRSALESASQVTDEASAIEAAGLQPRLVQGDASNLKVTFPFDLQLAQWILENREGGGR